MAEKKAQMGDFIGFSFNGIHSSELGLVRVSDGNRYEKNLFPAISDKTVQVPGRDGFYYFGSSYNTREMTVKVAFDNLEEKEFHEMVEHFKDKKPHFLWFDELPYKEYLVKIKSPPNFKYLCFDEWVEEDNNGEITKRKARIYKGEGTIIFVCYSPYARARAKFLDETIDKVIIDHNSNYPNWIDNYFLDGDNQIINYQDDQGTSHGFPPSGHPYRNGNGVKDGQSIRNLYGTGYLELKDNFPLKQFYNLEEWEYSSGIPQTHDENANVLCNCGDIDMNTKILLSNLDSGECTINLKLGNKIINSITIDCNKLQEELERRKERGKDHCLNKYEYFFLDSKTKLLQAYDTCNIRLDRNNQPMKDSNRKILYDPAPLGWEYENWESDKETTEVFNNCLIKDDFFKIPADNLKYTIEVTDGNLVGVEYTYLYY